MKQLKRRLCSTSDDKNIPELSVICCHSGFSGFLKMKVSSLPAMFCSRRAEETTQVSLSVWLSLETCKGISFCKTPAKQSDRTQIPLLLYIVWGTGPHTEISLNLKTVKKPSNSDLHSIL